MECSSNSQIGIWPSFAETEKDILQEWHLQETHAKGIRTLQNTLVERIRTPKARVTSILGKATEALH